MLIDNVTKINKFVILSKKQIYFWNDYYR